MKNGKAIFLSFLFLLSYTLVSWFFINFPPQKFKNTQDSLPQIINKNFINRFPDDLIITIDKGTLNTNQPSPFCLVLEDEANIGIVFDTDVIAPLLNTFDQNSPYQNLCQPIFLVGSTFIMGQDTSNGQLKIYPIPKELNLSVNKSGIVTISNQLLPILNQLSNILYYLIPAIVFLSLFFFTLLTNFIYSLVSKILLKIFNTNFEAIRGTVYGTSLFILTLIQFLNFIIFGWIINRDLGQKYSLSFPFYKTIITSLGTLIYFKCLRDTCKTLFSTTPIDKPTQPTQNLVSPRSAPNQIQTPDTTIPDSNRPPPPRKVHIDLTIPAKPLLGNDQNPPPHQV